MNPDEPRNGGRETYDLAIVGYGPTGITLAALAGRQGYRVIVLERYRDLFNLPRAACFDDEIMRTFQKLELVEEVMPGVVAQPDYEWVNASGETLMHLTYDKHAPGGWAALYMMYQPHIEAVLDRYCKSLPSVEVRQGVRIDALEQDEDGVSLRGVDREGAAVRVRARYAVGADGGAGFVRDALGVGISDYGFQENWLVCDFRKLRKLDLVPTFRQVCDPAQPVSIVQIGPEHHRFSFMLEPDESGIRATDEGRVWKRVQRYLQPEDAELVRVANYMFRSRVAEDWRDRRVLLAGDAAHEMPPFLAQGMCSGMRDSHNLAWKLDLVLSARASPDILDSYQAEREPHVRFITEKAIELGRVQTLRDPGAAQARDERLLAQRRDLEKPEKIIYPPISGGALAHATGAEHAGEFFPQGRVRSAAAEGLFDDIVGQGPYLLARSDEVLADLTSEQWEFWASLGGRAAVLTMRPGVSEDPVTEVLDVDGLYESWFASHGCDAAVVRPDWYLYGTAEAGELARLLDGIHVALGKGEVAASSA